MAGLSSGINRDPALLPLLKLIVFKCGRLVALRLS
jgi:hypothetical protein